MTDRYLTAANEAAEHGDMAGCAIYLRAAHAAWDGVNLTAAERSRVAAMSDDECRATADEMLTDAKSQDNDFCSEDKTYRIAFMKADGSWDYVDEVDACDDDAANSYAEKHFSGREWYVLDANGDNING